MKQNFILLKSEADPGFFVGGWEIIKNTLTLENVGRGLGASWHPSPRTINEKCQTMA